MQLDKEKSYLKREIKFFKKHPELIDKYAIVLKKLENDPFEPSLKLHKLNGILEKFHAVRLTYEYRIVLILMIVDEQIILVDIGTHDDVVFGAVKRYSEDRDCKKRPFSPRA